MAKITVESVFTGQTWTGEVPDHEIATDDMIFRYFNRVDEADCDRLDQIGFDQPSMSKGDIFEVNGRRVRVLSVGFEEI